MIDNNLDVLKEKATEKYNESLNKALEFHFIAVTKDRTTEEIESLILQGHKEFGENRLQEIESKWIGLLEKYPNVKLNFIGNLQSNKVKRVAELCKGGIHSIDRQSLVDELAKIKKSQIQIPQLFIEVNIGNEEQKSGVLISDLEKFYGYCIEKELEVSGLMCIPPPNKPCSVYFGFMLELKKKMGLKYLSMGMSNDFESAISLGASHIRVGRAIWQTNQKKN